MVESILASFPCKRIHILTTMRGLYLAYGSYLEVIGYLFKVLVSGVRAMAVLLLDIGIAYAMKGTSRFPT